MQNFKISRFRDGGLVLSCGTKGAESDLVFASGAMVEADPVLADQRAILERIVTAIGASEWQPIETAPRDGTELLLWVYGSVRQASWLPWRDASYPFVWMTPEGSALCRPWKDEEEPTHWMLSPMGPNVLSPSLLRRQPYTHVAMAIRR